MTFYDPSAQRYVQLAQITYFPAFYAPFLCLVDSYSFPSSVAISAFYLSPVRYFFYKRFFNIFSLK